MSARPRLGVLSFGRAPYDELARIWRSADALGFDSLWLDDDILVPGHGDFEAWTTLGSLAREATRARIGTLVSVITFRHPSFLASQVITLDHLSGGRAQLGFGAGGKGNAYGALGHEVWSARERTDRFEEQTALLDTLLRGDRIEAREGRYYPVRDVRPMMPVQRPRPPFIIAAHGERGLALAARYADGWNSLGGQPSVLARDPAGRVPLEEAVEKTRRLSDRLTERCLEIGRDPASIRRSVLAYWAVPDPLSSLDAFDEYVGSYVEIGIDEVVLYWPSLPNVREGRRVSPEDQARFERIATERVLTPKVD